MNDELVGLRSTAMKAKSIVGSQKSRVARKVVKKAWVKKFVGHSVVARE
jgi:hypothetical protein